MTEGEGPPGEIPSAGRAGKRSEDRSEDGAVARKKAIGLLGRREHSLHEIREKLRRSAFSDTVIRETLEWLEERGYASDTRFARALIREKAAQGWGPARIRAQLRQKGVPSTVAEQALSEQANGVRAEEGGEAEDRLVGLVERRFARPFREDPSSARSRAAAFVRRRGHDWETVERVVRKAEERLLTGENDGAAEG